jgi:hypothetical protein
VVNATTALVCTGSNVRARDDDAGIDDHRMRPQLICRPTRIWTWADRGSPPVESVTTGRRSLVAYAARRRSVMAVGAGRHVRR